MKMKILLPAILFVGLYSCSKSDTDTLPPDKVKDVDGNVYSTIKIGTQTWMKENLKVTRYNNGDIIPTGLSDVSWATATSGAVTIYNNDDGNNKVYGKLYNWYAATDPRKIAPQGWHIPSTEEWEALISFLGGESAGGQMKESGLAHWTIPNSGATNISGFTGLPAGLRYGGTFSDLGISGIWWSSNTGAYDDDSEADCIRLNNEDNVAQQAIG